MEINQQIKYKITDVINAVEKCRGDGSILNRVVREGLANLRCCIKNMKDCRVSHAGIWDESIQKHK